LDRPYETGAEGVEDGDLEVVDQAARQIGELGLRDELGERARLVQLLLLL